ncbi:cbb3-type cytochrome oxidase subunit 3 [Ralstonia solanacearum]|uniref:cbb3-type cytochrome oxidase subunit 3 n=1 Tax=Ralstonia solanacearum TaxID=305 RepID=UPI0018D17BBE|nr:cbb3-type cytochrome oxidase subunit 3 [Ralstonia solanacearum]
MAMLSAIATTVFLMLFIAITWWACSAHRRHANAESAMLPFLLPDEAEVAAGRMDASRPYQ